MTGYESIRPLSKACDDCGEAFDVPKRGMVPERCKKCRALRVRYIAREYRQVHADELRAKRRQRIAREVAHA